MNPAHIMLKKILKKTLENDICRVQSLDVPEDRNRVLKELMKVLTSNILTAALYVKSSSSNKSTQSKRT